MAAGVADVLGCARDANHVDGALGLESGEPLHLLVPLLLVVEGVKLEVDEGGVARDDRLFAVEESKDVVALLDVGLVGRDGKYLAAGKLLLADPGLHGAGVRQSVPTFDDLGGGVCRRPRLPSSCHFKFKLLNDRVRHFRALLLNLSSLPALSILFIRHLSDSDLTHTSNIYA